MTMLFPFSPPAMVIVTLILAALCNSSCLGITPTPLKPSGLATTGLSLSTAQLLQASQIPPDHASALVDRETLLKESWEAYRQRFIQADGRVIDWEDNARTVSEGQAYAMLRAVLADDPETFEQTLRWAENNLRRPSRPNDNDGVDRLWAWKWGQQANDQWGILDQNFASDADIDAITALIFAARRWQRPDYLDLARLKLEDLWVQATVTLPALHGPSPRYLLPGSIAAFQPQPGRVYLNPSYFAPYAFRIFAQIDPDHDWLALVESSYDILDQVTTISPKGLPSDWVVLDLASQTLAVVPGGAALKSQYGFDAYRVWWRLTWDAAWFKEARANAFLDQNLAYLEQLWQQQGSIPAILALSGEPLVEYEATAQYAMLYLAFLQVNPTTAEAIHRQKLVGAYHQGIWDNTNAYYVQNLAWLGLFPPEAIPPSLLEPLEF